MNSTRIVSVRLIIRAVFRTFLGGTVQSRGLCNDLLESIVLQLLQFRLVNGFGVLCLLDLLDLFEERGGVGLHPAALFWLQNAIDELGKFVSEL